MSYNNFTAAVVRELGFENERLPVGGTVEKMVGGVMVWVDPLPPAPRRFRLRLMCKCPECGKTLSLGRLDQHKRRVHRKV